MNYFYLQILNDKKSTLESQFTNKEDSSRYLNIIKIAFSKVLKEPKTPAGLKPEKCLLNNSIVYPESSKDADYLAKLYGTTAVHL